MRGAHLLRGSTLHVLVHSDGNLPIRAEEAELARSAIAPKAARLHPLLIYYTHSCSVLSLKDSPSVISEVLLKRKKKKEPLE